MNNLLKANVVTHLRFCARNRLVLVFGLLVAGVIVLCMSFSMFFISRNSRFDIVLRLFGTLSGGITVLLGLIALLLVWYHRSQRCVKLVFTKPCTPEVWVLSHYLTGAVLGLGGMALVLALTAGLMGLWGLPWQWGVLPAAFCGLLGMAWMFSYLMALSTVMHPILAFFALQVLSDRLFYQLALMCRAGAESTHLFGAGTLLFGLEKICLGLYLLLPGGHLFGEHLSRLNSGFRMEAGDWPYLLGEAGYTALFVLLMYLLTVLALKRQRQV